MTHFTVAETAILTGTDPKAVHNAVEDILPHLARAPRLLTACDVVVVKVSGAMSAYWTREAKREFAVNLRKCPRSNRVVFHTMQVDVTPYRSDVARNMWTLHRLRHLAISDPTIMGGEPVFRGTRIPIAQVAKLAEAGEDIDRIRDGYPSLSPEQIRLAPLWVKTYPRRGRPPARPWTEEGSGQGQRVTRMRLLPTP